MIQQTQLDFYNEVLSMLRDLTQLLTVKNIDDTIAGIRDARAIIADKNKVLSESAAAQDALSKSVVLHNAALKLQEEVEAEKVVVKELLEKQKRLTQEAEKQNKEAGDLLKDVEKKEIALAKKNEKTDELNAKLELALEQANFEKAKAELVSQEFADKLKAVTAFYPT